MSCGTYLGFKGLRAIGFAYSCKYIVDKKSGLFDISLYLDVIRCLEGSKVCFSK